MGKWDGLGERTMRKKIAAAIVTLTILAATYGMFLVYFSLGGKQTPRAENGFLDLTAWRFADDGVVPLDGEWEFYPDKLLSHEDFASSFAHASGLSPERIEVPGSWSNRMKTLGMATYRLRIKVGDSASVYGLKTSSIQMSNRIIVNGQVAGQSGNPAERRNYEAVNRPYAGYFTLQPGWNEIIVQVANFEFPASSGITESIYLGYAAQISGLRDKALAHDWITFTAFLMMGLYFIGLYSQRKDDTSLIVFGLVCVFFALFTSTRGERVLFSLFGSVPFWLYLRIQMVSALGAGMGFLLYVYTAFRPFCSKWLIRIGLVAGMLLMVWAIGFIPRFATDLFRQLVTIYATFPLLYAIYVFVLAAFRKVEGSLYLAVSAVALNIYALVQNLNVYFAVPVYAVPPFEPFVFLLMLALLMSLRFSNAFRKIEELSVQLLKADKLKDDFLARTSHEFKSPLHGVMHISRSMLDNANHPPTAEQREKLELITSITGRLSQLVYDILDFSKLKQGELAVDPTPVDVRPAVEMQVRIYSFLCADRNIRMENRVPEHLPYALADESRFGQIVGNLLDNAVKHTENGSIVVTAAENRGMIEISVQDTGEGIEAQNIPHLFEAFQSFDETAERRGFGLGLSIVKQLVELQNGTIAVSSTKGAGTTFMFTLPIAGSGGKPETASRASGHPVKAPEYALATPYYLNQKGKHTVLIVDDQFLNLKVLMDALEPLGYNVIAVKNGYEALEQIGKPNKIDLVVLDLMMPGISGYEVCQEIRKTFTLPELPVLMVTAAIGPQDKVAAFEAGANDFLPKPFDLAELKARIGSLLAMKESLAKAVDLEVAFLQSQIKPHFLYNVLNSIVASSYTDAERSRKLTTDLADYLRGSFRFSNAEHRITFEEEFSLIRTYVEIEKARFKDRLQFEYDIAEGMFRVSLPPLLLQPLVENAIRHGIGHRIEGGTVKLSAFEAEGEYRFVIEDNGVGIENGLLSQLPVSGSDRRQGVGLLNINKRLKYEYGTGLQMESEPGRGTKVTVRIPAESA
ncbi:ATP-binding protein [Paenibacillus sp. FSL M7-1455]|uniref:hybrid sensor histidine kinase/response regulator n=1 Tax=Paenibacillus TaxID=44249 RepID=UPI0020409163|nr:ATP-binding protein [Paenibacillus lactis]MCM3494619.1 ATP-binding protein [Paenibacillus lactis]